ncbi:unnamed protein product, partial [Symbiodinium pilosum]
GEEPGFVHTMPKSQTSELQDSVPFQADPYEIRKPSRFADAKAPVKEGSAPRTPNTN